MMSALETSIAMLRTVGLLQSVWDNDELMRELGSKMVRRVVEPGTVLFRSGDVESTAYFIVDGALDVVSPQQFVIFTMSEGTFFREHSLLCSMAHPATVVCGDRQSTILTLEKQDLEAVLRRFPQSEAAFFDANASYINDLEWQAANHKTEQ
mmetsp:Transcript_2384/g.7422  ORF Transcript_2384/g.7422 Transcript_2384/m.7422 type:complete len:152 (-) Transcript_2384:322-777(-)